MENLDKNLISLKEAAKISGYSSDYVGQLIRQGKIPGKQVYLNIAWMTTADAVLAYKNGEKLGPKEKKKLKYKIGGLRRKIGMQMEILKIFFNTFKSAWPIAITIIISFLLLNISIFYFLNNKNYNNQKDINNKQTELGF